MTREAKALSAFVRHLDDWPRCHVFLAMRPDEPEYSIVRELEASLRGLVQIYRLGTMQLADPAEQARLIATCSKTSPRPHGPTMRPCWM